MPTSVLEEKIGTHSHYSLKTSEGIFNFQTNIADSSRLIAFLPQKLTKEQITAGFIGTYNSTGKIFTRKAELTVEKVIIIGEETRNATNTYEMLLTDYIQFKDATAYLVYDSKGNLIRPSYVKNNEENAYTLKIYYDAKQVAAEHTPMEPLSSSEIDRIMSSCYSSEMQTERGMMQQSPTENRISVTG